MKFPPGKLTSPYTGWFSVDPPHVLVTPLGLLTPTGPSRSESSSWTLYPQSSWDEPVIEVDRGVSSLTPLSQKGGHFPLSDVQVCSGHSRHPVDPSPSLRGRLPTVFGF